MPYTFLSSPVACAHFCPLPSPQDNRWRKRALSLVPVRYPMILGAKFPAVVSIFKDDGTVAISTGGVEMGQGLNTKVNLNRRHCVLAVIIVSTVC